MSALLVDKLPVFRGIGRTFAGVGPGPGPLTPLCVVGPRFGYYAVTWMCQVVFVTLLFSMNFSYFSVRVTRPTHFHSFCGLS